MIRAIISPIAHSAKPLDGGKTKPSFFWQNAITEIADIETLLEYLFSGHSIVPAYVLPSPADNVGPSSHSIFVSQELWFVDLDNYNIDKKHPLGVDTNLTVENIENFCSQHNLIPFLIYETFSSTVEVPRFRVGFRTEEVVVDLEKRNQYTASLVDLFGCQYRYIDTNCVDLGRFFYGTSLDKLDNAYLDDEAIADFSHLPVPEGTHFPKQGSSNDWCSKDKKLTPLLYPSIEAYAINDEVDGRYHEANCVPFEAFLEHSLGQKFCCEFHADTSPSACIEIVTGSKYRGEFRYACYSNACHVYLSPIEYLVKKNNCSKAEALISLLKLRDIKVYPEFWQNIHGTNPDACRILGFDRGNGKGRNGGDQIMVSITLAAKLGIEIDGEALFPLADKSIGEDLMRRHVHDVSPYPGNIQPKRVRLCYLKLLRPVDDLELQRKNPAGLKYFRDLQMRNRHSRRCNWYAISTTLPMEEQLRTACLIAQDLKEGGCTGSMSQDMVLLNAGTAKANEIYVQDQDKELSGSKERLVEIFSNELVRQVDELGWSAKKKVLKAVYHRNYGFKIRTLEQCWYSIIKTNEFCQVVINQPLREELNVPEEINRGSKIVVKKSLVDELRRED